MTFILEGKVNINELILKKVLYTTFSDSTKQGKNKSFCKEITGSTRQLVAAEEEREKRKRENNEILLTVLKINFLIEFL